MIIGWIRLLAVALIGLTIVYFLVSLYSQSVRRESLEKEWDTDPAREEATQIERDAFIEMGMKEYHTGLKKRLLWLIFILPLTAMALTIYLVN